MRFAYLVMFHNNFEQVLKLLSVLDDENNDIYIHLDKKTKDYSESLIGKTVVKASITFVKRVSVNWAGYSQVKAELSLLEAATKTEHVYYHLLSGADLPLKSQKEIREFFYANNGKEYIGIDSHIRMNTLEHDRIRYFYFFQDLIGRNANRYANMLRRFEGVSIKLQKCLKIDRVKQTEIEYVKGSQWFSITHRMAEYVIREKKRISLLFRDTLGPDEFFLQTVAYNSPWRDQIVNDTLRCIDWKRGSPYVFTVEDYDMLSKSSALFARKFDMTVDTEIIDTIVEYVSE